MKSLAPSRRNIQTLPGYIALILAISSLLLMETDAQRRPVLRPIDKDFYAGKILLIPTDDRPTSFQQPRLIAEVADHELITPPIRLLKEPENLAAWLETYNFDDVDGVIISLDKIFGPAGNGRTGIFGQIRLHRPGIPIYAFITPEGSDDEQLEQLKGSLQLADQGHIDQLLIATGRKSMTLIKRLSSDEHTAARAEKLILDEDPDSATILLVGRMLNRRFGYEPAFLSVYSSIPSSNPDARNEILKVQNQIVSKVRTLGGRMTVQQGQAAGNPEVVLYLHMPGTGDQDRNAFIQSISLALDKNLRIVLIDLSKTRETRESLLLQLRQFKLLDRLTAYAAHTDLDEATGDIVTRAIEQASAFLLSIRFMRDDLDRVRRIDRAQIRLLMSRYLTDFFFPFRIREDVLNYAKTELKLQEIPADNERLNDYATDRIRVVAEELFNEQFRRNIHATLLSTGERAQFEIRLLQRVQVRIYPSRHTSSRLPDVEITPSVYLVHLGNLSTPLLPARSYWELTGDVDDRIVRRWEEINWLRFKVDAESVEMRIKIDQKKRDLPVSDEGYAISNKLARGQRRIEITAGSLAGAFYALGRLEQLGVEGRLSAEFQIVEAPAYKERAALDDFSFLWSDRERAELMRFLGRNRMNSYYFQPGDFEPDDDRLLALMRKADENFLRFTYVLSPADSDNTNLDQQMRRLAALGVTRFGLPDGSDTQVVKRTTEKAKSLGVELSVIAGVRATRLCPSTPAASTTSQSVVVRPGDNLYFSMPGLANAADYAWQGNQIDSENSFTRALQLLYDERSINAIRQWSRLTGECQAEPGLWKALIRGEATGSAPGAAVVQQSEQMTIQLREAVEMIAGTRDRGLLRGELARRLYLAEKSLATWKGKDN